MVPAEGLQSREARALQHGRCACSAATILCCDCTSAFTTGAAVLVACARQVWCRVRRGGRLCWEEGVGPLVVGPATGSSSAAAEVRARRRRPEQAAPLTVNQMAWTPDDARVSALLLGCCIVVLACAIARALLVLLLRQAPVHRCSRAAGCACIASPPCCRPTPCCRRALRPYSATPAAGGGVRQCDPRVVPTQRRAAAAAGGPHSTGARAGGAPF